MWSSISVVIPVYNSSDSLEELYERLVSVLKRICHCYEIVMVDDGSRDNSFARILQLRERNSQVKAIRLAANFGQQNALLCGFHYSSGEYIVTIDDDLQHWPEEIEKLITALEQGYDIIFGIPKSNRQSLYRRVGSKLTGFLFDQVTSKPPGIKISSFRAFQGGLLKKIISHKTSFVYISAIIFKYTDQAENVYVQHDSRRYGRSNYNFFKLVGLFVKLYLYYAKPGLLKIFASKKPQFIIKDIRL